MRIPKLIGVARMTDMMLNGRIYNAADGECIGLFPYVVEERALVLAEQMATNAPVTNYALIHALPRIVEQPADHGLLTEAWTASIAQAAPEAKVGVQAFPSGQADKVKRS